MGTDDIKGATAEDAGCTQLDGKPACTADQCGDTFTFEMETPKYMVAKDDDRIKDPTTDVDLRLTMTEWVLFWKTKYANAIRKTVAADTVMKQLRLELINARKQIEIIKTEYAARDTQAVSNGIAKYIRAKPRPRPAPKEKKPTKKAKAVVKAKEKRKK